jgi:hypothetical protein
MTDSRDPILHNLNGRDAAGSMSAGSLTGWAISFVRLFLLAMAMVGMYSVLRAHL